MRVQTVDFGDPLVEGGSKSKVYFSSVHRLYTSLRVFHLMRFTLPTFYGQFRSILRLTMCEQTHKLNIMKRIHPIKQGMVAVTQFSFHDKMSTG